MSLPNAGNVFDYCVDFTTNSFGSWTDLVPSFQYNSALPYWSIVVPTVDTVRYAYCLKILVKSRKSIFVTGSSGVGKSVIIADLLRTLQDEGEVVPIQMTFSSRTSSVQTQETIESKLEKKRKTMLGAPAGKQVVVCIDDVNMPAVEVYGAQPPIELLRQMLDFKGTYDRKKLYWKDITDTSFMCSAAPPGGGRSALTLRFTRHFNLFALPPPTDAVLTTIFSSIMNGFLNSHQFTPDAKKVATAIVDSTIEVYEKMQAEMRPTPSRFHYTFNLRDISKVFQGLLNARPRFIPNSKVFTRLWLHETSRVFYDRLISEEDRSWFKSLATELINKNFKMDWNQDQIFGSGLILFGDYVRNTVAAVDNPRAVKDYQEITDIPRLVRYLEDCQDDFNFKSHSNVNLVFFEDAIEHLSRIARILSQPRGNAMLIGLGGSGKQSLTKLACHILDYQCFTIELTRQYGIRELRDDLKKLLHLAGVTGLPVAFLFTDNHIVSENFLEDINALLNSGEVPNLFQSDEIESIIDELRPLAREQHVTESRQALYDLFINRVRENLHLVLCMSPAGDALRVRCRMFPSLINCSTLDWYTQWPKQALLSVSTKYLADAPLPSAEIRTAIAEMCVDIHSSSQETAQRFFEELRRPVYTTPKSYLDLISLYVAMLTEKKKELETNQRRLTAGLTKLEDTRQAVKDLQPALIALQSTLAQKSAETETLLAQVASDQASAEVVKANVVAEEALVREQADVVLVIQKDAERDLAQALPALKSAIAALNALDKKDIADFKAYTRPPQLVQMVMEGVCILLGHKADWESAKKVLTDMAFISRLTNFDKDHIPDDRIKALRSYVDHPEFTPDNVARVSGAARSLCMWVRAMATYSDVAKEVEPKRQRLQEMNDKLSAANATLKSKQDQLNEVLQRVAELQRKCDEAQQEKDRIQAEAELTMNRVVRAEKLVSLLADEHVRWSETVVTVKNHIIELVGNVFVSAACISYFGAFTGSYRQDLVSQWVKACQDKRVPISADFSLTGTLGVPVQIREWNIQGLPTDSVSTDSAILVTRTRRYPLMIDPQQQANKWVRNMESKQNIKVVKMTDPLLLRALENAVRVGIPLLIEDIAETLDPILDPILTKKIVESNGRRLIRLGDQDVDFDPNFKLYLTTKRSNPNYLPEICIKVTVINFTVTSQGLEDQLLGHVVSQEKPTVEERKNRLVVTMANDLKQLNDIEEKILQLLSESKGMILDDLVLINTLKSSKSTSAVINERMREAGQTQEEIRLAREAYRTVATRGSILYFVVADLALIDPMYQYSLAYITRLFKLSIQQTAANQDEREHISDLIQNITETIYANVCRGLFEAHKTMFSFLICVHILRARGEVSTDDWNLFLRGPSPMIKARVTPNPAATVLTDKQWEFLYGLDQTDAKYIELVRDILAHIVQWKEFWEHSDPYSQPLPNDWDARLSAFETLLLIRALRPELVLNSLSQFVKIKLGSRFVESRGTNMEEVYADMDPRTPVIFVLSQGADPMATLLRFAAYKEMDKKLQIISLGQGQGAKAAKVLSNAILNGEWVVLQNCHLAKSWMPALEHTIEQLRDSTQSTSPSSNVHSQFRLFLTSMPAPYFPVSVLQNGVKITIEPPRGVKANLLRSFNTIPEQTFESSTQPHVFKKLLFGLCFFHATVQERRKFGPIGWNVRYEFNDSDLETSLTVLRMFLEEQQTIPWDALRYVTGQINYGGRVTDDLDRRCLLAILYKYYSPDILSADYKFSSSGIYCAPEPGSLSRFKEYIHSLPSLEEPEIFGMNQNANVIFQNQEAGKLLDTIVAIQPRIASSSGSKSSDDVLSELARELETQLPQPLERKVSDVTNFAVGEDGLMDSLSTVLMQEMQRFNRLLSVVSVSLSDLRKAIRGQILMSEELDLMSTSLRNNQVPSLWHKFAYPSLKPLGSWMKDLTDRVIFIRQWLQHGQPKAFWISGLFFPQGFMTGALQTHARKHKIAIDSLNFRFTVERFDAADVAEAPKDGVYVYGLYLEGATWIRSLKRLEDSAPGEIYCQLPVIHFKPDPRYQRKPEDYSCPVYKTAVRAGTLSTTGHSTNFVVAIDLPSEQPPDYWVLQGTACLCQLND
eukprot:GILJ01007591.1.p1 GENE.GILJ01007591.1~~GILJ01007591.1.p1  ORF type:complete len:2165 (-),score=376.69 GILJ01007591.1:179-6499(-)